jgi:hypothetical protein
MAAPGDTLVATSSSSVVLSAHAAARADGSTAVMLVNTTPSTKADVTLTLAAGGSFSSVERYDYAPPSAASDGSVVGPTPVTDFTLPYATEVAPFAIALFVLEP